MALAGGGWDVSNKSASESDSTTFLAFFLAGFSVSDCDSDCLCFLEASAAGFLGTGSFLDAGPGGCLVLLASIMWEKRSESLVNFLALAGGFFVLAILAVSPPSASESETSNSSLSESMSRTSGSELSDSILAALPPFLLVDFLKSASESELGLSSMKSELEPSLLSS